MRFQIMTGSKVIERIRMTDDSETVSVGAKSLTISVDYEAFFLKFSSHKGDSLFYL